MDKTLIHDSPMQINMVVTTISHIIVVNAGIHHIQNKVNNQTDNLLMFTIAVHGT